MDGNIQERLRRLGMVRGVGQVAPTAAPGRAKKGIEELLSGELLAGERGTCFLHRETYGAGHVHGRLALSALHSHGPGAVAQLARDERLASLGLERLAFIDTETTGLAGGTGTYAFLIGVGLFEAGGLTIYQFFMRDYDEEPAQIGALAAMLAERGLEAVVSFNGKSFDLPLLETRFIMARQVPRLSGAPHLDLLPVSRRVWKYRLESCALSALEPAVLGVQRREDDVPGFLIPALYAEYARTGDAREMPRIFYHNAQDILSLVVLAARLCELLAEPLALDGVPPEDLYGLGRVLEDLGQLERAEAALACAAETCRRPQVREMARRDLAALYKRQERRGEALAWWQRLAREEGAIYACEELAKHYEWQAGDPAQALAWTQQALALLQGRPAGSQERQMRAELEHRARRLNQKLRPAP